MTLPNQKPNRKPLKDHAEKAIFNDLLLIEEFETKRCQFFS